MRNNLINGEKNEKICSDFDANFCDSETLPATISVSILPVFVNLGEMTFFSKALKIKNLQTDIENYLEYSGINHKFNFMPPISIDYSLAVITDKSLCAAYSIFLRKEKAVSG
ncbi:hypothetical protein IKO70_03675 [bacterium]|nr:hypothetical protein [bacterium]